jgi:hypothetical protein
VSTKALDPRLDVKTPRCPLCHREMTRELRLKHGIYVFECTEPGPMGACRIAIAVDDPFVGRWEEALERATGGKGINCPMLESSRACPGKMRYFATRTGYMKAMCPVPGCHATMSNGGRRKEGTVENVTPEKPGIVQ